MVVATMGIISSSSRCRCGSRTSSSAVECTDQPFACGLVVPVGTRGFLHRDDGRADPFVVGVHPVEQRPRRRVSGPDQRPPPRPRRCGACAGIRSSRGCDRRGSGAVSLPGTARSRAPCGLGAGHGAARCARFPCFVCRRARAGWCPQPLLSLRSSELAENCFGEPLLVAVMAPPGCVREQVVDLDADHRPKSVGLGGTEFTPRDGRARRRIRLPLPLSRRVEPRRRVRVRRRPPPAVRGAGRACAR